MKRPNPIHPDSLSPAERRAELCRLLAAGLVRLMSRNTQLPVPHGDFCLHFAPDRSGHATPTHRRHA